MSAAQEDLRERLEARIKCKTKHKEKKLGSASAIRFREVADKTGYTKDESDRAHILWMVLDSLLDIGFTANEIGEFSDFLQSERGEL